MNIIRVLSILLTCVSLFAAEFPARLTIVPVQADKPLSQNTVETIFEDRYGFIWVGTQGGVHLYDGQTFTAVNTSNERGRYLFDDFVLAITETPQNNLWVATLEGLNFLGRNTMKAESLATYDELGVSGQPKRLEYYEESVLLTTRSSIYQIHPKTLSVSTLYQSDEIEIIEKATSNGRSMPYAIANGYKVISKLGVELFSLEEKVSSASVVGDSIYGIKHHELMQFDRFGRVVSRYRLPYSGSSRLLTADSDNQIWINIERERLVIFSTQTNTFENFSTDNSNLKDFAVRSIFVGSDRIIWIGTATSGLFAHDPSSRNLSFLAPQPDRESRAANSVRDIQRFNQGLVVATESGVVLFDEALNKSVIRKELLAFSVAQYDTTSLLIASEQGLYFHDVKDAGQSRQIGSFEKVRKITKVEDYWIVASENRGIIILNSDLRPLRSYTSLVVAGQSHNLGVVLNLKFDQQGFLWIMTVDGVYRVAIDEGELQGQVQWMLPTIIVRDLEVLNRKKVLIATHSGLYEANYKDNAYHPELLYDANTGLLDNIVYSVASIENKIAITTPQGITKFPINSREFRFIKDRARLGQDEFNGGVKLVEEGYMLFGGIGGITKLILNDDNASVEKETWISRVSFGKNFEEDIYFPLDTIELKPSQNNLAITFSRMELNQHPTKRYRYRISSQEWAEISNENRLVLGGLDSGLHLIELQSKFGGNDWVDAKNSIQLRVAHKTFSSPLAITVYVVLGLILVSLTIYQEYRRRKLLRKNHRQVVSSEARLKLALRASGYGLWDWDVKQNKMIRMNVSHLFPIEEGESEAHRTDEFIYKRDLENVLSEHRRFLKEGGEYDVQYRIKDKDDNLLWIHDKGKVIETDEQGYVTRAVGTYSDITELKRSNLESVLSNEIVRNMTEGLVVLDQNKVVSFVNPAFTRITGFPIQDLKGKSLRLLQSTKHSEEFYDKLWSAINQSGSWFGEFWVNSANNREILCSTEVFHIDDEELDEHLTVLIISNITEKRVAEEKLSQLARYDSLTGLPNRNLLLDRLEHALAIAKRHDHKVAVMFIDLDGFKKINDSLGHQAGDKVLVEVSKKIASSIRNDDTLARLSGDEFLLIIEDYESKNTITTIVKKILRQLNKPLAIVQNQIVITASIGIACYPDDANSVESILQYADTAMYQAKKAGKNDFAFYKKEMHANLVQRLKIENYLREAVVQEQLYVLYQPIVNTKTNRIQSAEALVRWKHPILGDVFPSEFIPLAEETGHILDIGYFVLDKVCKQIAVLTPFDISIAVNVSVRQLMDEAFVQRVEASLKHHKIEPSRLKIEITESLLMTNPRHAANILRALKATGVIVSIDDFGTGYSSLSYLKRFAIDELKIDKEFIADIKTEYDHEDIVNAILALAKSLNMLVVAEGVETQEQVKYLRRQGCDYLQGYLFSKPIDKEDFIDYVTSFNIDSQKSSA